MNIVAAFHLSLHSANDFFATVPHIDHKGAATRVQVAPPVFVLYPDPVGLYSPQKRLVQSSGKYIAWRNVHDFWAFRPSQLGSNHPRPSPSHQGREICNPLCLWGSPATSRDSSLPAAWKGRPTKRAE